MPARSIRPLRLLIGALLLASCGGAPTTSAPVTSPATAATTAPAVATRTVSGSPSASVSAGVTPGPTATPSTAPPLALTSPAFGDGGAIPARYTCSGADISPPLAWSHAPAGTTAFALVVVDTNASGFVHWVVSDIPGDQTALGAGARAGVAGRNSFDGVGYGGPCPPVGAGVHHYVFTLYALSHKLGLGGVPTATQVRAAAARVTLATARVTAIYRR
ncbi:MAG TPA: YbhB/YbcL family Raf kinase inhibitor-like protein [Candidatus Sulfotelmatobacter sp.]|nr:YbhB/YbcL family Raf kinase inhibitor-like protein [Candidatus Sulfotelmatobacter sp.]